VIAKAEHTDQGSNPRFVVTNLAGQARALYDTVYCARGEMENRIKEQQLGLFSDRTSCHDWWANQFGLLLSSCAYGLLETVRRLGLAGTELARAQAETIRLKLLKIGAVVRRNTRRVRLLLPGSHPYQGIFAQGVKAFSTG
jgi:Transposase DDE domain group 1